MRWPGVTTNRSTESMKGALGAHISGMDRTR